MRLKINQVVRLTHHREISLLMRQGAVILAYPEKTCGTFSMRGPMLVRNVNYFLSGLSKVIFSPISNLCVKFEIVVEDIDFFPIDLLEQVKFRINERLK